MLLVLLGFALLISCVSPESCFYQRCLGCQPEQSSGPGFRVECHPSNWVTAQWVHNIGHPPPSTDSWIQLEYSCLKLVATPDDKTFGNTVDVVRGCIPKVQVDSVCLGLVAVERARGHSDARCYVCRGNDCNSAAQTQLKMYLPIALIIVNFVFR
ncbi:unnamed protein product [Diatraea saccharalis]|uniref:Protein quiver n=1 Tax=Diatraea saccharalis TaxID=40085 RepID=A0A9N9R3R5_9NEOP|nr:unnamed protein product [Diatraea saccharalis]